MKYSVTIRPNAKRDLSKLPINIQTTIFDRLDSLSLNPRPPGVVKLKGTDNCYRIRVGDYRIIYSIEDDRLVILVIRIRHRREVYKS